MMNYKNRATRKPGQRVHVVTRSVGQFRKTDFEPRARPVSRPITMPARTLRMMTDAECGLPDDSQAQERAEEYIRADISFRLRQEDKSKTATIQAVKITVADDALAILDVPQDMLDGIASELRRITSFNARL